LDNPKELWDEGYEAWAAEEGHKELTGYECALFTKQLYKERQTDLPVMFVHSMNNVGTKNIIKLFKSK